MGTFIFIIIVIVAIIMLTSVINSTGSDTSSLGGDEVSNRVKNQMEELNKSLQELNEKRAEELSKFENTFSFDVAGVHVAARKSFIRNHCEVGDCIELVPEPNNPFGKDAVKVRCRNRLIGYVPAGESYEVNEIIKNNKFEAEIFWISDDGGWLDVSVDIYY